MSKLEEIKAAAAKLKPAEQAEFFRWWVESEGFKRRQLAALKRDIAAGIEDLESGRYRVYQSSATRLAEEISRSGRKRLKQISEKPKA